MAFTVALIDTPVLGLIVEWKTGIHYTNQIGGHSCQHAMLEGFYVPLHPDSVPEAMLDSFAGATIMRTGYSAPFIDYQRALERIFAKYNGWCDSGIDKDTADEIDSLLSPWPESIGKHIKVNRDKLKESMESWVWIVGTGLLASPLQNQLITNQLITPEDCNSFSGVLTWANSD